MAIIRQLKNFFTKQVICPKTLTKAVYDENGERLDKILRDTMLATDNEEYSGVEPRASDTLGGKYKSTDIDTLLNRIEELEEENEKLNSNLNQKQDSLIGGTFKGNIDSVNYGSGSMPIGLCWCHSTECSGNQPFESGDDVYYYILNLSSGEAQTIQLSMPYNYNYRMAIRMYVNNSWTEWLRI